MDYKDIQKWAKSEKGSGWLMWERSQGTYRNPIKAMFKQLMEKSWKDASKMERREFTKVYLAYAKAEELKQEKENQ